MCTVAISNAISEVLFDFVAREEMFTAFDVTKGVRAKLSETVLHREVRQDVHNGFDFVGRGYQRTPVTLSVAGNPTVFVYHPINTDAHDHPLAMKDSDADAGQVYTDSSTPAASTVPVALPDGVRQITKDKRVTIPRKFLKQVNPTGGSYDIMSQGDLICRKPNANGMVRIAASKLGGGSKFKITVENNSIHVSPA
jgi:hypothetical protein